MRPLVTIIIPFYNCSYVDQAVRSALDQSYSPIEIIVIDDGSVSQQERLTPYLPYIYYLGKANGGTATALNHGIRHAKGDYIAWLSSDDIFYREKVNHQVQFMRAHNAYISHTNYNYIDSATHVTKYDVAQESQFTSSVEFYRSFLNSNPVNGCTVMFRRELFSAIGLFNEGLPYTHDLDMWHRVIQRGVHFPYLNESLTGYRWHDAMGTVIHQANIKQEYESTQSRCRGPLLQILSRMNI
ncbi:glycosyltransferase [Paenibacillus fonticola]|uniref:glycosyltransferase n=1 Tax=Paenibacillus fonticola TaxID=379896 RepID=UPI00037020D7|nr:glycosyltransferase [Paenibacillus fonticola]